MEKNDIALNDGRMSSLEIAEIMGKRHYHLLRDIRSMEPAWEKLTGTKFGFSEYTDASGKRNVMFELSMLECLYVATKFRDEDRAKLVLRWFDLEKGCRSANKGLPVRSGYPEETVLTVKMGRLSNQIYVRGGEIFAKYAPICRCLGYESTPTYLLGRLGAGNVLKVAVGKNDAWFINGAGFGELLQVRQGVAFSVIRMLWHDLFGVTDIPCEGDVLSYGFTESEMLDILFAINEKPVNKSRVICLLSKGKKV